VREAERRPPVAVVALRELGDGERLLDDDAVPEVDARVLGDVVEYEVAVGLPNGGRVVQAGRDGDEREEVAVALGCDGVVGLRGDTEVVGWVFRPRRVLEDLVEVLLPVRRQHQGVVGEFVDVALHAEVQQERGRRVRPGFPVVGVVLALLCGEEFLLGVGVVGV
jgi:hypothetical protein